MFDSSGKNNSSSVKATSTLNDDQSEMESDRSNIILCSAFDRWITSTPAVTAQGKTNQLNFDVLKWWSLKA